jgi:1-phosphatidylinositol-4-phosphate 5-kinase
MDSSGKSGSLFYYTHDKRYMMKTVPEREFDSLREALPDYYAMIKKNANSLICRFYGLHGVEWTDKQNDKQIRYLVVMNNVFRSFPVGLRFDLKGSTASRSALAANQQPHQIK